jgi:hypothetical protein
MSINWIFSHLVQEVRNEGYDRKGDVIPWGDFFHVFLEFKPHAPIASVMNTMIGALTQIYKFVVAYFKVLLL